MQLMNITSKYFGLLVLILATTNMRGQTFKIYADSSQDATRIKVVPLTNSALSALITTGLQVAVDPSSESELFRPRLYNYTNESQVNSMDVYIRNLLLDPEGLQSGESIIRGFYLMNSIQNREQNLSSGLYSSSIAGTPEFLYITTSTGSERVKLEYVSNQNPALLFVSAELDNNVIQINWRHDDNVAWIYLLEEFIDNKWEKASPVIPFRDDINLDYSIALQEGQERLFRLVGRNIFGEKVVIKEELNFIGKDITAPSDVSGMSLEYDSLRSDDRTNLIEVTFDDVDDSADSLLISTSIYPDSAFQSYSEIIRDVDSIIIECPQGQRWIYVKCISKDLKGNESVGVVEYLGIPDFYPPDFPKSLKANIDSLGHVNLTWDSVNQNDLFGYLIESSTSANGPFQKINSKRITIPTYKDTLLMDLDNNRRFYRVAAFDKSMNVSLYSNIESVIVLDTIRPAYPIVTNISIDSNSHIVNWENGYESDVERLVICSSSDAKSWDSIYIDDLTSFSYLFSQRTPGEWYYRMYAIDSSNNYSIDREPRVVIQFEESELEKIAFLKANYEKEVINLSWSYPQNDEQFLIFQSVNGGPFRVGSSSRALNENIIPPSGARTMSFYVQVQNAFGELSEKSDKVEISIK